LRARIRPKSKAKNNKRIVEKGEEMAMRFSKGFKVTLSIIGVVVGLILLVMIIGAIGDASARGKIKEIRDNSLAFFDAYIRTEQGNAVEYFTEAAEYAKDVTVDFHPYLDGEIEISPRLTKAIPDNLDAIAKIEQGTQMEFYSYPYEYEKGASAEIPEYFNLNKAIRLTTAKALYDFENGRGDLSLDALFNVIQAGKLIATGTPVLFDVAIGNSFAMQSIRVLHMGIASGGYDPEQLEQIDLTMKKFESEWPLVVLSLEGEVCAMAVIFFDALKHPATLFDMGQMISNSIGDAFRLFLFRLLCWRYWFSPSRMYLDAHASMNQLVEEFKVLEQMELAGDNFAERSAKEQALRQHLDEELEGNLLLNLTFPSVFGLYNRRLAVITSFRAARLCCAIRAFQRDHRRFPVDLKELGGDIVFDFNTGKMWEYKNNGDSASLSSPGPDPDDDRDDISITLTNLGVTSFLKDRRATASKK
jgi:hypothetical protein